MASAAEELEAAVLALPRDKRARLAERLIASLEEDDDVEEAWRVEVRRRLEAYRDGDLDSDTVDDVLGEARSRIES